MTSTMNDSATSEQPTAGPDTIFDVRGVTLRFGGVTSLNNISLQMHRGEILAVIGPNGAGKTSLFNSLTGVYTPQEGSIQVRARGGDSPTSVIGLKTHLVNRLGVARTFQNIRLFANMTALENVMVGRYCRTSAGPFTSIIRGPKFRREEAATRQRAQELLDFVGLGHTTDSLARNLPYGDQRRLEIARALATDPKLLLLDEPTAGMNPQETRQAEELIFKIRDQGLAIVVIEHDMRFIFTLCDRVLCLVQGRALIEGTPSEVQSDPRVIEAYIGTGPEDASASEAGQGESTEDRDA